MTTEEIIEFMALLMQLPPEVQKKIHYVIQGVALGATMKE